MTTNQCHASTLDLSDNPMDRHPHEFEHGLYVADRPGHGGTQGFCWFSSTKEAIAWLLSIPRLFTDDHSALSSALASAASGIETLDALPVERINAIAADYFEVRWAGTFSDLMFSSHPFAREIQTDFHDMVFPDERGQGPLGTMDEDFIKHLNNYRSD